MVGEEALEDGGFAGARGAGDHDGAVELGGWMPGNCGISRCLWAAGWFASYLMAPWYVTVRAQVDNVESARAGRQQSVENDASGQCSTYKSNCRKDEKGMSSVE